MNQPDSLHDIAVSKIENNYWNDEDLLTNSTGKVRIYLWKKIRKSVAAYFCRDNFFIEYT